MPTNERPNNTRNGADDRADGLADAARRTVPNFFRTASLALFPFALAVSAVAAKSPTALPEKGIPIPRVTVTAHDFAYDAPDTVAAGYTEFVLKNLGPEMHHLQLMRLESGHTLSDLIAALKTGAPPKWAVPAGGPNSPMPGAEAHGTVHLRAGRYAMVCLIPSSDGVPHVMKGMSRELIVRPSNRTETAPVADVNLALADYSFALSKPLIAGKHTVAVSTVKNAPQPHEVFIVKLASGKTVEDGLAWMEKQQGPPPFTPVGGVTGIAPGDTTFLPLDLVAGQYAFLCFLPDMKDGMPHVAHGMLQPFTVKPGAPVNASR